MKTSDQVKALVQIGWKPTPQTGGYLKSKYTPESPIKFKHRMFLFSRTINDAYTLSKPFLYLWDMVNSFILTASKLNN